MNRLINQIVVVALFLSMATLGACRASSELEPQGPTSDAIQVLWNPSTGVMPTPTNLVRDNDTDSLQIPIDENSSRAQQGFTRYLNGLDGYPLSTPIRIPVSAPIDENSLNRGLVMIDASTAETISLDARFDDERLEIVAHPAEPFESGHTYILGIRGYEGGLLGTNQERVIADAAFYLVRSPQSLRDHPDAMPADSAAGRQEMADELAAVQEELAPAFEAMERRNIERQELAGLLEFTTTSEPAIAFDTATGEVPLPNDILVDPDGAGLTLPIDDDMSQEERHIREGLAEMDGFSMSAAIVVSSTHDFAGAPEGDTFRLFKRPEEGEMWTEVVDVEPGVLDSGESVWLRPELTLEPEAEYAYVITDDLQSSDGLPHRAQPVAAMLGLEAPLIDDDGESTLDQLSHSQARHLEPIRERADNLLSQLELFDGVERDSVAAVVPFGTASAATPLLERRHDLYERDVTTEVTHIDMSTPSGMAGLLLHNVETVVRGKMTILDYLDPATREWVEDGQPVERQVHFSMTLPEVQTSSIHEPVPVVLFGHGLMTSRELVYLIGSELASQGYAALSFDFPYHGERAVCIRDSDCRDAATCQEMGQCVNPDGTDGEMQEIDVGYMLPFLEGTDYDDLLNYPITSGEVFIDMNSLLGTRDHFAQALLDLNQAVRVIRGDELQEAILPTPGHNLSDEIVYLGMSLGGILGSSLSAIEPEIDDFVVNVPAADLTRLIEHSVAFETLFEHAMDERDIEQGSDDYFRFMNAARWIFDPIDPLNLVQHVVEDRLDYVDATTGEVIDDRQARVLIQMAEGDRVVPNIGTEILSQRMGIDYIEYSPNFTDHGFLFDPTGLDAATRDAREDMMQFYDNR